MNGLCEKIWTLKNASGSNKKKQILQEFKNDENFCRFLFYALNPRLTYKVSERTLRNHGAGCRGEASAPYENIFAVCDILSGMKAIDNETLYSVRCFLHSRPFSERELYTKLLAKTLRLGVTAKTVNQVIPGLIPEWEVQQAYPIEKYPLKEGTWFALTQKLNGVRATYYQGKLYARSGVPYEGLGHITDCFEGLEDYVFDGELTLFDRNGLTDNEAFRAAAGIINSESEDKTAICFTLFDCLPREEFDVGISRAGFCDRRSALNMLSRSFPDNGPVSVLPILYSGYDRAKIDLLLAQMVQEDKEGLMVNIDVPYQCKRHNGILKVKRFYTMDLPIVGMEEGTGRLTGTLGAFILDYKGYRVKVGSGFSDEQRLAYWNRDDLIGTLCEVKYKEISNDKRTGEESLQFPVFVSLRPDKGDVSYG